MKKIGWLLASLLILISLAACGGESDEASGSDVIELTVWNDWTEDRPENTVYKDMIKKFNEENEGIEVKIESIPHDQYETKLRTQAAGQQLPDMFRVWPGTRIAPLVEGNALLSLNEIVDEWEGVIPEGILKDYAIDGEHYAIPANISETSLIFYHKDALAEAGFDSFPATYEELKSLIEKLKEKNVTPIALGNKAIWPLQSVYISTIADRYTGSDFLEKALNGEASFTDERFVKALSVIEELSKMDAFNGNMNTIDEAQSRSEFVSGNTAMHFAGSWAIGPILDSVEDPDAIGVAPFPSFEGGDGDPAKIAGVAGGGIALNSDLSGEKKEAAFKFLKFFYSDEMFQKLVKANIIVPADVEMDDSIPQVFQEANSFAQGGLAPVYDATLTPELTDIINNGLQSITLGEKTPEELAKEMEKETE
ncbi:extracellular solute-binding protein [Sediminibacillus halophilus]|uniref:Raffinose/stachyose/melibiose transport system substrate-binding protein n=1 Tax=Sediminibacillus halophilus TaxID=482461 RepID=A0A1G9NBC8_9BACI|nr:extracellular solute-binding protein [Sediminibacillus halophilus]SDL83427.1 raffinose/stachyose/melibiose transport system substrate-binding protein [Sediminibacillus halophilus]